MRQTKSCGLFYQIFYCNLMDLNLESSTKSDCSTFDPLQNIVSVPPFSKLPFPRKFEPCFIRGITKVMLSRTISSIVLRRGFAHQGWVSGAPRVRIPFVEKVTTKCS
jgi:hypothetical protein